MKTFFTMTIALLCTSLSWAQTTTTTDTATAAPATDTTTSRAYSEEPAAHAKKGGGFYIEPGLIGVNHDADFKMSSGSADSTGNSKGVGLDLKLGGHIADTVLLALDAQYQRAHFDESAYEGADVNSYNWGPMVGVQTPVFGARLWTTYVLDGIYDPSSGANGFDTKSKDPYGWRFGVGFRVSVVSINLEYEDLTYRSTDIESTGSLASAPNVDFAQRGYGLSVSFPMDL
jgi:hypothetical protein